MTAFLDRIGGLFDRGLLLGALFPLLIFFSLLVGLAIIIFNAGPLLHWFESLSASDTLALTTALTIILFLLAFALRSLRRPILDAWSGAFAAPWCLGLERSRRGAIDTAIDVPLIWLGAQQQITSMPYANRPNPIPQANHTPLDDAVRCLVNPQVPVAEQALRNRFDAACIILSDAYQIYDGASLAPWRRQLVVFVRRHETEELIPQQALRARRAVLFGPPGSLRPTRLGNLLAALDNYPYERYRMEGGIFWPHLEQVMEGSLLEDVQNQRIMLDGLLAVAVLFGLLTLLATFVGPWLWFNWIWLLIIAIGGFCSFYTYRLAIPAATSLSSALRAGCDLYRHKLLLALGLEAPSTLMEERDQWRRLSQLVIYGAPDQMQLDFRHRLPPAEFDT